MRKNKLRVLCVIPGKPDNSSMIFARNECTRLRKFGLDSRAYYLDFSNGVNKIIYQILALNKIVRKYRPHIVHAHFGSLNAFICMITKISPLVITFRGSDLNPSKSDGLIRDNLQKIFSQLAVLRADAIICVSEELRNRLWWKSKIANVITTGVDTSLFFPIDKIIARKKLGLSEDDKIVLFVGGQAPKVKGLALANKSIAYAENRLGKINFLILYGDIRFEEMPLYFNAADCFLFTSDYEGSPCAIQEALACGVPIISVDVGDVKDRLKGSKYCEIVDRKPVLIGNAIYNTLVGGNRTNGPDLIANLSVNNITQQIVRLYVSCI
jgi:teichuronic acid biosynthesis glycosyltransferase TuaC